MCVRVIVLGQQGFGRSQHETRTDVPQDVRRVWSLSVLILSETIGNRTYTT